MDAYGIAMAKEICGDPKERKVNSVVLIFFCGYGSGSLLLRLRRRNILCIYSISVYISVTLC